MKKTIIILGLCWHYCGLYGQSIIAAEYFIDDYVAPGEGIALVLNSEMLIEFDIPTASLEPGMHFLHLRVKNSDGHWSLLTKKSLLIINDYSSTASLIVAEYFWDHDPGLGKGTYIDIGGEQIIDIDQIVQTSNLDPGMHYLHIVPTSRLKPKQIQL